MALHVVVDSTAGVSAEIKKKYKNLHVVSLQVILAEQQYEEEEVSLDKLFSFVGATKISPKTSQPSMGSFIEAIQPLLKNNDQVIVITLSGALSGTVNTAHAALKFIGENERVHIVDSMTASIAMVKMAEAVFAMEENGFSVKEILTHLRLMVKLTKTFFLPDTLEFLQRGGRIGAASALLGTILKIKLILCLNDGKVAVLDKVRTRHKAVMRLLEEIPKNISLEYLAVLHTKAKDDALAIASRIEKEYAELPKVTVCELGAVLAAHLGEGVLGIIFQEKIV